VTFVAKRIEIDRSFKSKFAPALHSPEPFRQARSASSGSRALSRGLSKGRRRVYSRLKITLLANWCRCPSFGVRMRPRSRAPRICCRKMTLILLISEAYVVHQRPLAQLLQNAAALFQCASQLTCI
jgi:hypothetical protein